MKKILLLLTTLIVLLTGAYIIYQNNLATENIVVEETSYTITADSSQATAESIATLSSAEDMDSTESKVSKPSVDITAKTISNTDWKGPSSTYLNTDGQEIDLSENYGNGTLINIWASWCEPCKVEMPYFEEAYQTYGEEINFLMINATESKPSETSEAALLFAEEMGMSMPVYFDTNMKNQYLFGATILPLTVILDDTGQVVEIVRGQVSSAKLTQLIEQIL